MRNIILASVCAAALLVPAAASAQLTGTLGGGYTRVTNGGGADAYGVVGSLATEIGSGWSLEGNGSFYNFNPGALDIWSLGGNLSTSTGFGRIAGGTTHTGTGFAHATTYGGGADWFFSDVLTLSLRGGGHYASGGSDGGYVGLQGAYYLMPNLALSASADYVGNSTGDINFQKLKAEWQFSDSLPLSVYGGYQRSDGAGTQTHSIFVGVKFYLDGAPNLVGHHRTGSLGYIGQSFIQSGVY